MLNSIFKSYIFSTLKTLCITLSFATISGCGFHLRSLNDAPVFSKTLQQNQTNQWYLEGQYTEQFKQIISNRLNSYGINLQTQIVKNDALETTTALTGQTQVITINSDKKEYILSIEKEHTSESIQTLGKAGQVNSVRLNYQLTYLLREKTQDKVLLSPQTINLFKDISITASQISANEQARQRVYSAMQQEAISRLIEQINNSTVLLMIS